MSTDKTQTISKIIFWIEDKKRFILLDEQMGKELDINNGLPIKFVANPHHFGQKQPALADSLESCNCFVPPHKIDLVKFYRTTIQKAHRGFLATVHTKDNPL